MRKLLVVGVLTLVAACHAKIASNLQLDGKPFAATSCRNGQALGFSGVELSDDAGTRIRLTTQVDGSTVPAVFAPNADRGDRLGACGTLVLRTQNSQINNISNIEGEARVECTAVGRTLSGDVTFENCH